MTGPQGILLTGATGFLGRYLLRDLLASGHRVAVLARDGRSVTARERVAELVAFGSESLGTQLARPTVLVGDLRSPGMGLTLADRTWLAAHCRAVINAAARISFGRSDLGEPWKTNVDGTQHLLDLCAALGLSELHHVSSAYVCGDRPGPVLEDDLESGQGFHNDYEKSKWEAERRLRKVRGIRATVYRPSTIVGDSRTGWTNSYTGFYRFLDLANRLAEPNGDGHGRRFLSLRLPLSGEEPRNLVPVDWVSQAMVRIINQPQRHGYAYHLTSQQPVRVREIKEVAEELLAVDGVGWAGPGGPSDPTPLEETFLEQLQEYEPYLHGDPAFDCRNTRAALPRLPAPRVDRVLLSRLIRFAIADQWGRNRPKKGGRAGVD